MSEENTIWQGSGMAAENSMQTPQKMQQPTSASKTDTIYTGRMKSNFGFFGGVTLLYAIFYAFCMYKNGSGITFPFFIAASLLYLCFSLAKLEITLRKGSGFYMVSMMLLAVSTFCTDDGRIIAMNKTGIFFLMMSLMLSQFYDTSKWKLGKYLGSIAQLVFGSIGELGRPFEDLAVYLRMGSNQKAQGAAPVTASAQSKGDSDSERPGPALSGTSVSERPGPASSGASAPEHPAVSSTRRTIGYIALGALAAVPVLIIVITLLASADAVFREITIDIFDKISISNIVGVSCRILFLYFAVYLLTAYLCRQPISTKTGDYRRGEPIIAITVTSLLSLIYLLFSGIQIIFLFLGQMQLPEGYTYAEYARQGFFELLAVSALNLIIVLFCMAFFRESRVLKIILMVMSLCTFIMILSSAMRMIIYIRYYYMTFLRLFVLWALVLLFFLFTGVIISIFREQFHLFRYSMAAVTVLYLILSFSHPDYIIASINLANAPRGETVSCVPREDDFFRTNERYHDFSYMQYLSADATPVILSYLEELGYQVRDWQEGTVLEGPDYEYMEGFALRYLRRIQRRTEGMGLRSFNVSRYMAWKRLQ